MSSFVKYRVKEVAADFGMTSKEISAILEKYFVKPKSPAQVLEEDQLNVIFDYLTQQNQISSIEVAAGTSIAAFFPCSIAYRAMGVWWIQSVQM